MSAYLPGFTLGLSLILAIGSQNAFVLKQGLKKHHVFMVCLVCALSDAILISLGVAGFGTVVKAYPEIEIFARYGGAVFLIYYGISSLITAFSVRHTLNPADEVPASLSKTLMICLAFTWLNPHVYLDTVVLLGSISTQYEGQQLEFAIGAVTASFVFFFSLGYGARVLLPWFQKPVSWKILDAGIGLTMLTIAYSLI